MKLNLTYREIETFAKRSGKNVKLHYGLSNNTIQGQFEAGKIIGTISFKVYIESISNEKIILSYKIKSRLNMGARLWQFLGCLKKYPGIDINTSQNIITVSPFNLGLLWGYKYVFNISHLGFTVDGINFHMSQKS